MLADTQEAFASIPITEDPWLVAVNVSQGRAEAKAASVDLLPNGKCFGMQYVLKIGNGN